jgi:hypothetical protein
MGRKRLYADDAARQRAYRERVRLAEGGIATNALCGTCQLLDEARSGRRTKTPDATIRGGLSTGSGLGLGGAAVDGPLSSDPSVSVRVQSGALFTDLRIGRLRGTPESEQKFRSTVECLAARLKRHAATLADAGGEWGDCHEVRRTGHMIRDLLGFLSDDRHS